MSNRFSNPSDLLLSLGCMTSGQIEAFGRETYEELYVEPVHETHDGERGYFYSNRFEHAFYGSESPTSIAPNKDQINRLRIERMKWIGALIQGRIAGSSCLLVKDPNSKRPARRLYLYRAEHYIVWLEPRIKEGDGWWFSSAYTPFGYQIKKYTKDAELIARF